MLVESTDGHSVFSAAHVPQLLAIEKKVMATAGFQSMCNKHAARPVQPKPASRSVTALALNDIAEP